MPTFDGFWRSVLKHWRTGCVIALLPIIIVIWLCGLVFRMIGCKMGQQKPPRRELGTFGPGGWYILGPTLAVWVSYN